MKRSDEYYKKVMHTCLCQTVMFKKVSEDELLSILKGVVSILADRDNLTQTDKESCLMYFWQDYNKGLSTPMSDEYIRQTLIPAVLNHPNTNMAWAMTVVFTAGM